MAGTVAATAVAETVTATITVIPTVTVTVTVAVTNTVTATVATAVSMSMEKKLIFPQHGTDTEVREPAFTATIETDQGPFSLKIAPTKAHFRSGTAVGRCWGALDANLLKYIQFC